MSRGLSLANKVLLLFSSLIVVIIGAALVLPWIRMSTIVERSQLETSRHIASLWEQTRLIDLGRFQDSQTEYGGVQPGVTEFRGLRVVYYPLAQWEQSGLNPFGNRARERLAKWKPTDKDVPEYARSMRAQDAVEYNYARLVRDESGETRGVLVVQRRSETAAGLLLANRAYLIVAWIGGSALAALAFWFVIARIILSPVRKLRDTAEMVQQGNLGTRSDIQTGDEFQQLSETFNSMLTGLSDQQQMLRSMNKSLDDRLSELAQRNTDLYQVAREKGEFLANISHELRTPLNSIIGFAELLQEVADAELETQGESDLLGKRRRYLTNIVNSGRSLLEMINELLMMAKLDAGKLALTIKPTNVAETCAAAAAVIRPLIEKKHIEFLLRFQGKSGSVSDPAEADLPIIDTDPQKFHQVVFNFLSNAVKFTPEYGRVELRAERVSAGEGQRVRVSVIDNGPGIPRDQHTFIFKKFSQLDAGHSRQHQGTGLGLAIAKEFATMLKGEIQLESDAGRGSMFSLILPVKPDFTPKPSETAMAGQSATT